MNRISKALTISIATAAILVSIALVISTYKLTSEQDKRIELEAQLDNLAYQLENDIIGFLITKMPDSVGVNIYGITLTYSLEGDSEIREITFKDTIQQEHKGE